MEQWTEEKLMKLSVKELKLLARKSNVNPNTKKLELVKALINTDDQSAADRNENYEAKTSRRMTRSRVSMFQPSAGVSGSVVEDESKEKMQAVEGNTKKIESAPVESSKFKKRKKEVVENSEIFNTSEMFPLVSSIHVAPKPLLEITNKDVLIRGDKNKQRKNKTTSPFEKSRKTQVFSKNTQECFPTDSGNSPDDIEVDLNSSIKSGIFENSKEKDNNLNNTFIVEGKKEKESNRGVKNIKYIQTNNDSSSERKISSTEEFTDIEDYTLNSQTRERKNYRQNGNDVITRKEKCEPEKSKKDKRRKPKISGTVDKMLNTSDIDMQCGSAEISNPNGHFSPEEGDKSYTILQTSSDKPSQRNKPKRKNVNVSSFDKPMKPKRVTKKKEKGTLENEDLINDPIIEELYETVNKLPKTVDSKIKFISSDNSKKLKDLKKRKKGNGSKKSSEIVDCEIKLRTSNDNDEKFDDSNKERKRKSPLSGECNISLQSSCAEPNQNRSRRKRNNHCDKEDISSFKEVKESTKPKHSKKRKQETSSESESSNSLTFQETSEVELDLEESLSCSQSGLKDYDRHEHLEKPTSAKTVSKRSTRSSEPAPVLKNDSITAVGSSTIDSMSKPVRSPTEKSHSSTYTHPHESEETNLSPAKEKETGKMPVPAPIRQSTFILHDTEENETKDISIEEQSKFVPPTRSNTFTIDEEDVKSCQRKSLRFSPASVPEKRSSLNQPSKLGKSIGSRIMQSSILKRTAEKSSKKETGSTMKKTTIKSSSTTPGSVFKKRPAGNIKMPDFKKIHQKLFNNMESLSDNKKRNLDRAQALIMSPAVPKCAVGTPKPTTGATGISSSSKGNIKVPMESSPLANNLRTPKVRTPMKPSPLANRLKTPVAARQVAPTPSVNRFGFRKPVKKEEASNIIGKKLPSINLEKKKENVRSVLQGVRMNKRFMLQMQMRQSKKQV